ncbi:hypothetical protein ScPMuIL_003580 [Solemya velum]
MTRSCSLLALFGVLPGEGRGRPSFASRLTSVSYLNSLFVSSDVQWTDSTLSTSLLLSGFQITKSTCLSDILIKD